MDISVSFPAEGRIRLQSRFLFGDPTAHHCRQFVERLLDADEVSSVSIRGNGYFFGSNVAEIRYCPTSYSRQEAIAAIYKRLAGDGAANGHPNGNGHTNGNGHANGNGYANGHAATITPTATATPTAMLAPRPRHADRRDATPGANGRRRGLGFRIPKLPLGTRRVVPRRPAAEGSEWEVCHESPRPHPLPERAAASPQGGLPGHRARADERPGDRQVQDQLAHLHGPGRLRPAGS